MFLTLYFLIFYRKSRFLPVCEKDKAAAGPDDDLLRKEDIFRRSTSFQSRKAHLHPPFASAGIRSSFFADLRFVRCETGQNMII